MNLGEKIKEKRKEAGISVEAMAEKLGISFTTLYRYEKSDIVKIPTHIFTGICEILNTTPAELMGNTPGPAEALPPKGFDNPQDAMAFVLKIPTLAAFGGYDPAAMSDDTIVEFANELLQQLQLVSYKYKNDRG